MSVNSNQPKRRGQRKPRKKTTQKINTNQKIRPIYEVPRQGKKVQSVVQGAKEQDGKVTYDNKPIYKQPTVAGVTKMLYSQSQGPGELAGTNIMSENPRMSTESLQIALLTYASYIYNQGIISSVQNSDGSVWWYDFSSGLAWLGQAIQSISQGATQDAVDMPRIFDVMSQLCSEKTIKLHKSLIRYSPQWESPYVLQEAIVLPNTSVYTVVTPSLTGALTIPYSTSTQILPQRTSYSFLLKIAEGNKAFGAQIVKQGETTGLYTSDPSAFARVYPYFGGSGSPVAGCYNEVELEAPFHYPAFSRFVRYDTKDLVISKIFRPSAGGLSTIVGTSLVSAHCDYSRLRNPIPVNYKFIDLNQLVMVLCSWVISLAQENMPTNSSQDFTGFTFSQSDFVALIRQSVLTMFPSQCHAQFVSPLEGIPLQSASVFMPLIVDSITTPTPNFANTVIPGFLNENLAMLRGFQVAVTTTPGAQRNANTPKSLCHEVVPVWGVWSGDILPDYQFRASDGLMKPLFATVSVLPAYNVWDCKSTTVPDNKVNINYGLAPVMTEWNNWAISAKNRSAKQATFACDTNPKVSLLCYTRYLANTADEISETSARPKNAFSAPLYDCVKTLPKGGRVKEDPKKKVQAVVPSTYFDLYTRSILSLSPLPTSVLTSLQLFITPTIRLTIDPQLGDNLSMQAYQVYTGELSSASTSLGTPMSDNEVGRNFISGQNMTSGLFAADADNDVYTQAIATIEKYGSGSDVIKSLLGGIASMIPIVGPTLGNVINSL